MFTILHESLGMRKLFSKWMPRSLTPGQKERSVEDSECCLKLFKRGKKDFLRRYVTMDETWIHKYTLESNRMSAEWTVKSENSRKRPKTQMSAVRFSLPYFGMRTVFYLSITLRKGNPSIANIIWRYCYVWREKLQKNDPKWRRKKCSFTKTMHTSRSQQWQNCSNCTLNCFLIHRILWIWLPVTTICLRTQKECFTQRNLAPMKKWLPKLKLILSPTINRFTKKALKYQRSGGMNVSLLKETMLINEVEFFLKFVVLLVTLRTYWVMCYEYIKLHINVNKWFNNKCHNLIFR